MQISDCMESLLMFFALGFFSAAPLALAFTFTLGLRKVRFDA